MELSHVEILDRLVQQGYYPDIFLDWGSSSSWVCRIWRRDPPPCFICVCEEPGDTIALAVKAAELSLREKEREESADHKINDPSLLDFLDI